MANNMSRKCYACIKQAQDGMRRIQQLSNSPVNLARIAAIAAKFNADFADVDPDWKPGDPIPSKPKAAPARDAGTQARPAAAGSSASASRSYAADPRAVKSPF